VGEVVPGGPYTAFWRGDRVLDLPRETLEDPPALERPRRPRPTASLPAPTPDVGDWQGLAAALCGSAEICTREWIYRHYDPEVRGDTVLRPGDAEACVITPLPDSPVGVAVAVGGDHRVSRLDPRIGGRRAVAEAVRNLCAVGAVPLALTDGLNFGNPEDPEVLWDVDETLAGMREACLGLAPLGPDPESLPIVSGNVSLYNESTAGRAIPPTPLVAAFGRLDDAQRALPNKVFEEGQEIVLVRRGAGSLGGSVAARILGAPDSRPWSPVWEEEVAGALAIRAAHREGLINACRDISHGGLLAALLELLFHEDGPPERGIRCAIEGGDGFDPAWLLAEGTGYVAAAPPGRGASVVRLAGNTRAAVIGRVIREPVVHLDAGSGPGIRIDAAACWSAWRGRLEGLLS
jgi:phosphoribosylformylglycinamidine synthase